MSLMLDFTHDKICNISKANIENLLKQSLYRPIKSECRNNHVFIFMTIDGKEYKFTLDTGFSGNIIIPYSEGLNFSKFNAMALEGSYYQTIHSTTNGLETFYEAVPVQIGSEKAETKVCVSNTIKAQNIGMTFIKCFDWIIDFNHNKVYIKPNSNKIEKNFNRRISYLAQAFDKLRIVTKEKSQIQYQLGDEIISVNGKKVTAENNCELQDFLNKTDDWSSLELEVISNLK
jgi:predicted aspartyl protease